MENNFFQYDSEVTKMNTTSQVDNVNVTNVNDTQNVSILKPELINVNDVNDVSILKPELINVNDVFTLKPELINVNDINDFSTLKPNLINVTNTNDTQNVSTLINTQVFKVVTDSNTQNTSTRVDSQMDKVANINVSQNASSFVEPQVLKVSSIKNTYNLFDDFNPPIPKVLETQNVSSLSVPTMFSIPLTEQSIKKPYSNEASKLFSFNEIFNPKPEEDEEESEEEEDDVEISGLPSSSPTNQTFLSLTGKAMTQIAKKKEVIDRYHTFTSCTKEHHLSKAIDNEPILIVVDSESEYYHVKEKYALTYKVEQWMIKSDKIPNLEILYLNEKFIEEYYNPILETQPDVIELQKILTSQQSNIVIEKTLIEKKKRNRKTSLINESAQTLSAKAHLLNTINIIKNYSNVILNVSHYSAYILSYFLNDVDLSKLLVIYPTLSQTQLIFSNVLNMFTEKLNITYLSWPNHIESQTQLSHGLSELKKFNYKSILENYKKYLSVSENNVVTYLNSIYFDFYKQMQLKNIGDEGLTYIEKFVVDYILSTNQTEYTINELCSIFMKTTTNISEKKIKYDINRFIEGYSQNTEFPFFKFTGMLYVNTLITPHKKLMNLMFFNNSNLKHKNNIIYPIILPLIYYNRSALFQIKRQYLYKMVKDINEKIVSFKKITTDNLEKQIIGKEIKNLIENIPYTNNVKSKSTVQNIKGISQFVITKPKDHILTTPMVYKTPYEFLKSCELVDPFVYINSFNEYVFSVSINNKKGLYINKAKKSDSTSVLCYSQQYFIRNIIQSIYSLNEETQHINYLLITIRSIQKTIKQLYVIGAYKEIQKQSTIEPIDTHFIKLTILLFNKMSLTNQFYYFFNEFHEPLENFSTFNFDCYSYNLPITKEKLYYYLNFSLDTTLETLSESFKTFTTNFIIHQLDAIERCITEC